MKNFKTLFVLFLLGAAAFGYSCSSKTDSTTTTPQNPSLTVSPSTDQTAKPGDMIAFAIVGASNSTSNSGLTKIHASVATANGSNVGTAWDSTLAKKPTNLGVNYTFSVPAGATDGTVYTITFTLTDDKNNTATSTRNINVKIATTLSSYSAVMILVPSTDKMSKTFYSSSDNTLYSRTDADNSSSTQSKIDFAYYYGVSNHASITSPYGMPTVIQNLAGWSVKNNTMLGLTTLTSANFDAADNAAVVSANSSATMSTVTTLIAGDVLAFKTVAGKMGLIRVSDIKGTYNDGDYMKIDVKVQK